MMPLDDIRRVVLVVSLAAFALRIPAIVRDPKQRPWGVVLTVYAIGALAIQPWFCDVVDASTGVAGLSQLFLAIWDIVSGAVMLELVIYLTGGRATPGHQRVWFVAVTVEAMMVTTLLFALTPTHLRSGDSRSVMYPLVAIAYVLLAAALITRRLWRRLPSVSSRLLRACLLMITVPNATLVLIMVIAAAQRLAWHADRLPAQGALVLDAPQVTALPLVALLPAAATRYQSFLLYCRRIRVYSLWRTLRLATAELTLTPPMSRGRDLVIVDDAWERLHRRVIDIWDSIFHLRDTWASSQLLEAAARYAGQVSGPADRDIVALACWLEVTRRAGLSAAPKLYCNPDNAFLAEPRVGELTGPAAIHYLVRLHRALRSRVVDEFATAGAVHLYLAAARCTPVPASCGGEAYR